MVSMKTILIAGLCFTMQSGALAALRSAEGGVTDGGGDALVCWKSPVEVAQYTLSGLLITPFWPILNLFGADMSLGEVFQVKEVFLADTYQAFHGPTRDMELFARQLEGSGFYWEYRKLIEDAIREENPQLADAVTEKMKTLQFEYVTRVRDVEDDGIPADQIPSHCRKVQLALQNIETGVVSVRKDLFWQMTSLEQELLRVHEAFIALQTPREIAQRNTEKIRKYILALASDSHLQRQIREKIWSESNRYHRDLFEIAQAYFKEQGWSFKASNFESAGFLPLISLFGQRISDGSWAPYLVVEFCKYLDNELVSRGYTLKRTPWDDTSMEVWKAASKSGYPIAFMGNLLQYYYALPSN